MIFEWNTVDIKAFQGFYESLNYVYLIFQFTRLVEMEGSHLQKYW
jgi:hypothetical protein